MLELSGVGFAYARGNWVLRGVDLAVRAGQVTAVLGPNGRGKTTLLRCAAGLLRPQEGRVRRERPVSFVPQAHSTAFAYRALDMVLMGRVRQVRAYSTPGRRDREIAAESLQRVGAHELAERSFAELSGGERQLVLIARALASGSGGLILDEPASALDLRNQGRVLTLLRELAGSGIAVLMTTHHPDHAMYAADSAVLMLGPGRTRSGPVADLLTDGELSGLYGVPVRTLDYDEDGTARRVVVPRYDC